MKKLLIAAFLIASVSVMNAQETAKQTEKPMPVQAGDVVTRAHKQTEHLFQILSLTAEQKEKIYAINLEKNKEVDAARVKAASTDLFVIERKRINEERDKAVTTLLNAEQKEKWTKSKEEAKKNKAAKKTTNAVD